jgi:hypothetical protein
MKRLHVHVAVEDLSKSIGFYSTLFATEPSVVKSDYAKWMLDDPRMNFAISARGRAPGLDHLGIQFDLLDPVAQGGRRRGRRGRRAVLELPAGRAQRDDHGPLPLLDAIVSGAHVTRAERAASLRAHEGREQQHVDVDAASILKQDRRFRDAVTPIDVHRKHREVVSRLTHGRSRADRGPSGRMQRGTS